eukprot:257198_1
MPSSNNNNKNKSRDNNKTIKKNIQQFNELGPINPNLQAREPTPGSVPPPFGILRTPFFKKDSCTYEIHPVTLAFMNADANMFDTISGEGVEGTPHGRAYNNYRYSQNNKPVYTHTTIYKNNMDPPYTPITQIRPPQLQPQPTDGQSPTDLNPSPSLIRRPIREQEPIQPPPPQPRPQPFKTIERPQVTQFNPPQYRPPSSKCNEWYNKLTKLYNFDVAVMFGLALCVVFLCSQTFIRDWMNGVRVHPNPIPI